MITEAPDQRQLWDTYGHAMGAALAVELLMRIALLDAARRRHVDDRAAQETALHRIIGLTFGGTAREFMQVYEEFGADERFSESIGNARDVRNGFAHHFLEGRLDGLLTEDGVKLIILECVEATDHFRSLESHIRERCNADFDGFFRQREGLAEEYVANHPLRERLAEIEAGKDARRRT